MPDAAGVARLRELFARVTRDPGVVEPERQLGYGPGTIYFDDDADALLISIVDALAGSALIHGGRHRADVDRVVVDACRVALDDGYDAAMEFVKASLQSGLRRWNVVESTWAVFNRPELHVGRCGVYPTADALVAALGLDPAMATAPLMPHGRLITTSVEAFDVTSAQWRASQAFEEAHAILLLASSRVPYNPTRNFLAVAGDGSWQSATGGDPRSPRLYLQWIDASGQLYPGYCELSDAARKVVDDRTDWEGRTLGAARWYLQAKVTRFPSASLVAGMSALEALLLPPKTWAKAATLAEQMRKFGARVPGVPVDDVPDWLENLYSKGRNPATHEADFYENEREVDRFLGLVEGVVRWAVGHLTPLHRTPNSVCTTMVDAHRQPHNDWPSSD